MKKRNKNLRKERSEKRFTYMIYAVLLAVSIFSILLLTSPKNNIIGFITIETPAIELLSKVDLWFYAEDTEAFKYEIPGELTRVKAVEALMQSEIEIEDMKTFNLKTYFVEDTLLQAKQMYVGQDFEIVRLESTKEKNPKKAQYLMSMVRIKSAKPTNLSEVFRLTQRITFRKQQAYRLLDEMSLFEEKVESFKEKGTIPEDLERDYETSKTALKEERYDESRDYLKSAEEKLRLSKEEVSRIKKIITLGKRNWLALLAVILGLIVLGFITYSEIRIKILKNKLERFKIKRDKMKGLMKELQEQRFNKGTLSYSTYKIRMDRYREDLAMVNRMIPVLESMLSKTKKKKKPKKEKEGILKVKI